MRTFSRRRPRRAVVVLLVTAFVAAACAGDVGKYRDLSAGDPRADPIGVGRLSGDVGADHPGALESPVGEASDPDAGGPRPAGAAEAGRADKGPAAPSQGATGGRGDSGVTPSQVTVGLFYPNTGLYAPLARNWPRVLQAAFNEVNDQGGINGRRIVLKTYDDAGSDANTIAANHRRARDEVFAYLSYVSTTNEILAPLADKDGVPILYGNIPEKLGQTLRYGFAAIPYWATQARIMPSYIVNRLEGRDKRIGVTFEDSQTAINAKDTFKTHAAGAGLKVVFEQPVGANQATCTNEAANLQSHRVEMVVMIHGPFAAICMLRDARALGYRAVWTGFGSVLQTNTLATATGGAADGLTVLASITTLETQAGKHYSAVMRKYQPDSDADEDDVGLVMYGFAQLLIQALRGAGPDLDREQFVATMETKTTRFASGYLSPPTFGPGNRRGPEVVAVARCCTDNRWTTADPTWRERF